jgi:uncharacterized protein with FMN-binding domain
MKHLLEIGVLLLVAAAPPGSDRVELLDGTQYDGKLIQEKPDSIRFEVEIPGGGGKAQIDIPTKNIYTIAVSGKKRVVNEKGGKVAAGKAADPGATKSAAAGAVKTKADIAALVKQMGGTPPDWFAATPLNFPPTLDLTWSPPPQGSPWDPNKNVGQFLWSTINENENRWKEGVKFLHHMLGVNKDKPATLTQIMNALGSMYHNLFQDWARAAFWWQKSGSGDQVDLAHCYFRMGCKDMALDILKGYPSDDSRHASIIRLWSEMGDSAKALQMAEQTAKSTPDVGNLAAGDVCRAAGKYPEALAYYQKVIAATAGARDIQQNKKRAQASIDAIRLVDALDLKKIPDGKYPGSSIGYAGPVDIEVTVSGGKIADVKVTQHHEKQYYSSIADTTAQIIKKQGAKGVDATAGATITSEAIINATLKGLAKGSGK